MTVAGQFPAAQSPRMSRSRIFSLPLPSAVGIITDRVEKRNLLSFCFFRSFSYFEFQQISAPYPYHGLPKPCHLERYQGLWQMRRFKRKSMWSVCSTCSTASPDGAGRKFPQWVADPAAGAKNTHQLNSRPDHFSISRTNHFSYFLLVYSRLLDESQLQGDILESLDFGHCVQSLTLDTVSHGVCTAIMVSYHLWLQHWSFISAPNTCWEWLARSNQLPLSIKMTVNAMGFRDEVDARETPELNYFLFISILNMDSSHWYTISIDCPDILVPYFTGNLAVGVPI